jgi:hypothetical protein
MLEYSKMRAKNNLIYGTIHETSNQIHCHLMISSNEIGNTRNLRHTKKQLAEFKIKMSEYVYKKYPQIKQYEKLKTRVKNNKEEAYKKRAGKPSDREIVRDILKDIFANSQSQQDFISRLQKEKLQIYQRGQGFGFLDITTGKKYRLKTLELESEFDKLNQNLKHQMKNNEYVKNKTKIMYINDYEMQRAKEVFRREIQNAIENNKNNQNENSRQNTRSR